MVPSAYLIYIYKAIKRGDRKTQYNNCKNAVQSLTFRGDQWPDTFSVKTKLPIYYLIVFNKSSRPYYMVILSNQATPVEIYVLFALVN